MFARRVARPASCLLQSTITPAAPTRSLRLPSSSTCPPSLPQISQPSNRRHLASRNARPADAKLPSLGSYDDTFADGGVPGLLSAKGFEMAWTDYQQLMVNKVRNLVAGEAIDFNDPRSIAIQYARDPLNASLFNHASMAHNNHFFFQGLSTNPTPLDRARDVREKLKQQFGSLDNARISFIESAANMFGPGFTWLVWNPQGRDTTATFNILNTYAAGTPYGTAGYRRQEHDMATNNVGSMGPHSAAGRRDQAVNPGSARLTPLLCVNTWQHVYMYDYGVGGKRDFLNNWWDVIDWTVVQRNYSGAVAGEMHASPPARNYEDRRSRFVTK